MASKSKRARTIKQRNLAKDFMYWAIAALIIKLIIISNVKGGAWLGADGENYLKGVEGLLNDGIYSKESNLNYWPAGYPLIIYLLSIFGKSWVLATLSILQSAIFSFALFSTMSAMIIAGPRVSEQIGNDFSFFKKVAVKNRVGTPVYAILLQALISIALVLFSSFQELIQTLGITLSFFSLLTVLGIFIIRKKYPSEERPVKTWGYPFTPIIFIIATVWMIFSFALMDPIKIWYSVFAIIPGILVYFIVQKNQKQTLQYPLIKIFLIL
jgi:amino acid transporter